MEPHPSSPSPDKQIARARQKKIFEILENRRQGKVEQQKTTEIELESTRDLKAQMEALLEKNKQDAEANLAKPLRNNTIDLATKTTADAKAWDDVSAIDDPKKKAAATKTLAIKIAKDSLPAKNKTALPDLEADINQKIAAIIKTKEPLPGEPPNPRPEPAPSKPKATPSNEQAKIELQKETQKLKDAVTDRRNAYASADLAITGSWAKIKNVLPLTKESPNKDVINMKESYQKALKEYTDFQLEKIAHIRDDTTRKKEMHTLYLELSATEATTLLDTKWNMKAEAMRQRNDISSKALIGLTKLGENWRKLSWKKKLGLSAAVLGAGMLSTAWGPAAIIAGLGGATLRGLGTLAAYKGSEQMMEATARGLREKKAKNEIEKEQKNDAWYESLSEKLDAKIASVDVDLRKLEHGQTLRKGTALAFAGFVASGTAGHLIREATHGAGGWMKGFGSWISDRFTHLKPDMGKMTDTVVEQSKGVGSWFGKHFSHYKPNMDKVTNYAGEQMKGVKSWFSDHFTQQKPDIPTSTVASHNVADHGLGQNQQPKMVTIEAYDDIPDAAAHKAPGHGTNIPEAHPDVKVTAFSDPEINHTNYLTATNGVETAIRGDSAWKMIGRQLEARYGERFGELSPEQKTYVIDHLKNVVQKYPGEFGLADADRIRIGQKVDLSKLFENDSTIRSAFTQASNLDQSQLENIARNNKTILSFLQRNKGVFLSSDLIAKLLKK